MPQDVRVIRELEGADIALAYKAMAELRRLAGVAGFRLEHLLAQGRAIYVDDLSTRAQYRGKGHGRVLMEWIIAEARRLGCDQLHLDSGVGPGRADAHRLYLNKGLRISAHHFQIDL